MTILWILLAFIVGFVAGMLFVAYRSRDKVLKFYQEFREMQARVAELEADIEWHENGACKRDASIVKLLEENERLHAKLNEYRKFIGAPIGSKPATPTEAAGE